MANIIIRKDSLKVMTIVEISGILSADEIINTVKEFYAKYPSKYLLWNMLNATTVVDLETPRIKEFLATITEISGAGKRPEGKTAIVVSADIDYGLSRMFKVHAEFNLPYEYGIFKDIAEAEKWLFSANNS